ncbi:MAG TPA: hypothetical protein PKD78_05265, partial [Saprospiraceae bacterium]|nr:hypothetical protein [Saprospiraceae bacterium]
MLRRLFAIPDRHPQGRLLAAFAGLCVLTISASIVLEAWWLMALPAAMLTVWVAALDFRPVFFLMLAAIPLSMEAELPGGLGTDLV